MDTEERILVVDDDAHIRDFVSQVLSDEGYKVKTAHHGAAALEMVTAYQPALILLDMRMPVMDGWAFTSAYREIPGLHAQIIVLTAATDAAVFAAQVSADDFLAKPFDLDELLNLVARFVRKS